MANSQDTIKPAKLSPSFLKKIEDKYGPINMEKDFFSGDLDTYYKTTEVDKDTNSVSHDVIPLASFSDSLKKLSTAVKALKKLLGTDDARSDESIQKISQDLKDVFNKYRTYLRKSYPEHYEIVKNQLEEISTTGGGAGASSFSTGTGAQYATPFAFNKNKKSKGTDRDILTKKYKYKLAEEKKIGATLGPGPKAGPKGVTQNAYIKQWKYKLVPDKIKGSGVEVKNIFEAGQTAEEFQIERIAAFDKIEQELNNIYQILSNAKNETAKYYSSNPGSYEVVVPTDMILEYIKDIKDLLQGEE